MSGSAAPNPLPDGEGSSRRSRPDEGERPIRRIRSPFSLPSLRRDERSRRAPANGWLEALLALTLCLLCIPAFAQTFPDLTGRVVDQAAILTPEDRTAIEGKLKAFEEKTSDQVVVATVRSLEGTSIEDYANRLFRTWKLGTQDKNNGVLLLVAPSEKKVRIEVGYGLEGALTDALTGIVIRTAIAPRFKAGDFAGGINAGVDAILSVLAGDAEEWQRKARPPREDTFTAADWLSLLWVIIILIILIRAWTRGDGGGSSAYRRRGGNWIVLPPSSGGGWGGGFSGGGGWSGGSSGGFSGGGGSSGGGGASGSW